MTPVLSLAGRRILLPARVVRPLARVFAPLFHTPVVVAALIAFVALDVTLWRDGNVGAALDQLFVTPTMILTLIGLLVLGGIIHETGHAAACHYGGARPGAIGFGLYVVFPAFYTDVTDSVRLSRNGRVRTDLGGLYFNVWCLLLAGAGYAATGAGVLLLVMLMMQLQMVNQLVPALRLDGYYLLADVAGVPDLFARVRPVLLSLVPGRPVDPRVTELKPAARRLVIGWVLVVVPLLLVGFAFMLWSIPAIIRRTQEGLAAQGETIASAWSSVDVVVLLLGVISIGFLVLPLLGISVISWRVGSSVFATLRRFFLSGTTSPAKEVTAMSMEPEPVVLTASAFTDAEMLPPRRTVPTSGWQRAVYAASGGAINVGPGAAEQHRQAIESRLRTPIERTRRVVVMSRKGGVGKTTITLALGSTFSTLRGDRVIAVDANPDAGNLARRAAPPSRRTITDVLEDLDRIDSYATLMQYVVQAPASRLEVLASDDDPRIGMALDRDDYHRLIALLDHYYNLILLDTGTGILDSANQGLLSEADELVLVLRAGVDGARAAALTLDWLEEHDYGDLVARAVVVVNAVRKGVGAPLEPMTEHFAQRCSRVVTVPWDPALETGGETALSALRSETRAGLVEMAAAVADNFANLGARRSDVRSSVFSPPAPGELNGDSSVGAPYSFKA